jgi:excisionase family DNA binding protein
MRKEIKTHFTLPRAAEYLRSRGLPATKNFVHNLILNGTLPRVKVGKNFVVSRNRLDEWLAKSTGG